MRVCKYFVFDQYMTCMVQWQWQTKPKIILYNKNNCQLTKNVAKTNPSSGALKNQYNAALNNKYKHVATKCFYVTLVKKQVAKKHKIKQDFWTVAKNNKLLMYWHDSHDSHD